MDIFDYYRQVKGKYTPKTPSSALRGYEIGVLREEAFISIAISIKSVIDEPLDISEIERVLSRKDHDLKTNILLVQVLERLIQNDDTELALFAAESLNIIENRYNRQIESLKKELKKKRDWHLLSRLARLFFEMALLNEGKTSIKNFYLREAFSNMKQLTKSGTFSREDLILIIRILLHLNLPKQALYYLKMSSSPDDPMILLLRAEIEFKQGRFENVYRICRILSKKFGNGKEFLLPEHAEDIIHCWLHS